MGRVLIVHDDSVISRTAYLLEERRRAIRLYESILKGENKNPEYKTVNMAQIRHLLEIERDCLKWLIDNARRWLFEQEFDLIEKECLNGGD